MASSARLRSRTSARGGLALALAGVVVVGGWGCPGALAQEQLRNSFPGRRVGGGTRGECSARVVAHLVPSTSVFAPGPSGLVAVLQGPSADPKPLVIDVMPLTAAGSSANPNQTQRLTLSASGAGVVLLNLALASLPKVWESAYQCEGGAAANDPLGFVQAASPPARSLLVADVTPADQRIQAGLQTLKRSCGSTIARDQLVNLFSLADVITPDWPQTLPVRCP